MKGALILLVVCIILELNLVHAQLRTEDEAQPKRQDEQMSKLDNAKLVKGTEYQQAIEGAERQPSLLSATAPGAARVAHDGHDQQQLNAGHKIEKIADQKLEGAGGIESRQFKLEPKTNGAQPIHDQQQQQPKTAIEGGSSRQNEPQYRLPAQGRIDNYGGDYGHDQQQQKNNAEQQQFKTEQEQRRQLMTEGAQAADTKMTQPRVGVEPKSFEESKQLSQDAARPFETKLGQPKTESTASQRQFEGANEQMAGPDLFSTAARIASKVYGDDQRQNNEQQREDKFRQTQTHFIEGVHGEQQANKMGAQRFVENANADTRQQGVNNREEMHQKQQNNRFEQDNKNHRGEQQQNTKLEQDNKFVRAQQQDKLEQDSRAIRGEQEQNTKLEQDSESRTSRGEQQQNKLEQDDKLVRAQQQNAKLEQDSRAIRGEQQQNAKLEQDSRAIRGEQQQNKLEGDNKQPVRGEQQEVRQADPSLALERARARERQAKLEAETRVRTAENRARQAKLEAEARANRAILEAKVRQAEHRARIGLGGGHADAPAEQQQQQLDHPSKPGQVLEQQQKQFNNQQKFGEQQAKPQPQQAAEHNANQPFVGQQAKNQQAVEHQQANPLLINTPQMRENVAPQPLAAAGH
ncbi:hypothetical protein GPALN_003223 [Globodera pallida]|nr:hypothetical protein GPALN_003223 [Globodera pallida]